MRKSLVDFAYDPPVAHIAVLLHNIRQSPAPLPTWVFPWGAELLILSQIFLRHQSMVYIMLVLVTVTHVGLWHTPWGLRTRAVGEHPQAAKALGILER